MRFTATEHLKNRRRSMFKRYASERSAIGDLVIWRFLISTGHLSDSGVSQELITCTVLYLAV